MRFVINYVIHGLATTGNGLDPSGTRVLMAGVPLNVVRKFVLVVGRRADLAGPGRELWGVAGKRGDLPGCGWELRVGS